MAATVENNLDAMLKRGFSKKMATLYLNNLEREKRDGFFDADYLAWAHEHGFYGESATAYNLTEDTIDNYLSDYDYCRVWPLNDWQRIWINDKLTFAYMFWGTEFQKYLPESYYYCAQDRLVPLLDSQMDPTVEGFLALLREKGEFAAKPCNGEWARGFHKLSYVDGTYLIDNKPSDEAHVRAFVDEKKNLLYTEFFHPSAEMARIDPLIHTLRILMVNRDGAHPYPASAYLRFAMGTGGDDSKANYHRPESRDISSYNVGFDMETGRFGGGHIIYGYKRIDTDLHPDSGVEAAGTIDQWPEIRRMLTEMSLRIGPLEYLGYDVGITDRGVKLMEINSHSGCKYLQVFRPYRADAFMNEFFSDKLAKIDALDEAGIARRNALAR